MFQEEQRESFPQREERILQFWKERQIFEKSLEIRKDGPIFSIYDGPPFATGLPHYGHLLAGTIKDVVPRYKAMQGFYVPRRFGWDCHGLPVENEIEQAKELSGSSAIESFGIDRFNEECRQIVLRYTGQWKHTVERMGRWVDFQQTYRTMDMDFMESVWWVFHQLYEKGLVYEGFKVMPFSTKLGTPLSNFEANLNYKEVDDPSATVAFESLTEPGTYFLIWTTTPWTLPSNLAIMAGPQVQYVKVRDQRTQKSYILAEQKVSSYFPEETVEILERFPGTALEKRRYHPVFPFFAHRSSEGAFRVILEESVSVEEGTGLVHGAPAFGEVDFFACKREGIELVCPVDANGQFTQEVAPYAGQWVKQADKQILKDLKQAGALFQQKTVRHRYPFCWRSDTPLIYKAVRTWFVAVEKIKEDLLRANQEIDWVPGHIKTGRFGKWLENARDWAISRNRYWGTPIPLWRSPSGKCLVISSVAELEAYTGAKITDLHRDRIDDLSFEKEGEVYRRIPEVFDCWFESGSMPYAQNHFPFEGKERFAQMFPADFIAEGIDQTRGWFYTLTVLSAALFQSCAFKHIIVNGIILAEDGNKMSKRLKNYPDPQHVLNRQGADAIRLYMLHSPAVRAEDLRFSEKGVDQVLRQVLIPFWNAFVFLSTYAKIYQWVPSSKKISPPQALIDQWILSLTQKLIHQVQEGMDRYELNQAVEPFVGFIDQLTNWYIRRCRMRFWADEDSLDRREAFTTLYQVLLQVAQVAAPFIPFLSEAIYRELRTEAMPESVHLCDFPKADPSFRKESLEQEVQAAQLAVRLGHAIRKEHKLKVRQPLAQAHLITSDESLLEALKKQKTLIAEELNLKSLQLHKDEESFVSWQAKPNFPILGKKIGRKMPQAQEAIAGLSREQMKKLMEGRLVSIQLDQEPFILQPEDVQIHRQVKEGLAADHAEGLTVALDTALTEDLLEEGLAREIVNKVNTMRRELGLEVTDRICLQIDSTERVEGCFKKHESYITKEVLALQVQFGPCEGREWDLNGEKAIVFLTKVSR